MAIQFKLKLAPSIATLIVLPILMSLGFWQLDRAELKQHQLDSFMVRTNQPATPLTASGLAAVNVADAQYRKFEVTGQYDTKRSFLVDNRVHQSQVGYYVITPFKIGRSNTVVLVNRGWIKGKRYRADLPEFSTLNENIMLKGMGYLATENFFAVENVKINTTSFPVVVQSIDYAAIGEVLKMKVYPFTFRLDPMDKTGFVRDWKVVTSSAEKSQSYAAQWFTMALIVFGIFLNSSFKRNREKTA